MADEGTLFSDEGLELAAVFGGETISAASIAAFQLSLALSIAFELCGGRFRQCWG